MTIGYGLIGLGGIARTHLQALRCLPLMGVPTPAVRLAALLTTSGEKAGFARQLGFAHVSSELAEFLALPGLDVVDICTPNYLHRKQLVAAARAGKHVYCEKPLLLNAGEGEGLEGEIGSGGVIQVAYVLRFLPAVARARALLNRGWLGEVHSFRFELYHSSYLNPDKAGSWRQKKALAGGGALMDLGCHLLDLVRFLLGEAGEVCSRTATVVPRRRWPDGSTGQVDVDDHALVALALDCGARGTVEVSRVAVGGERLKLEIYGSRGSIHITPEQAVPRCFDKSGRECRPEDGDEGDPFEAELRQVLPPAKLSLGWMADAHAASLAWFLRSVETGRISPGTPDLQEGLRSQTLLAKAYREKK